MICVQKGNATIKALKSAESTSKVRAESALKVALHSPQCDCIDCMYSED